MNLVPTEASHNTFLIWDLRHEQSFSDPSAKRWLQQRLIEAERDSLLILTCPDRDDRGLIRMLVLERDGSFSDYCGNGARAVCDYLRSSGAALSGTPIRFVSRRGIHRTRLNRRGETGIEMLAPLTDVMRSRFFAEPSSLSCRACGGSLYEVAIEGVRFQFVDSSEPHLVTWENLTDARLAQIGEQINRDRRRFPFGMNVNRAQRLSRDSVSLLTYERGLNRITAACGTGATAAAYAHYVITGNCGRNVRVQSRGGTLRIEISGRNGSVWLWGPQERHRAKDADTRAHVETLGSPGPAHLRASGGAR